MNRLLLLILLWAFCLHGHAQPVGKWAAYASLISVNDIASDEAGRIWVATEGGVYAFNGDSVETVLTTIDNLYQSNPSALAYNGPSKELWLGYSDGTLQAYNTETKRFTNMQDIFRASQFSRREINRFMVKGDSLLVACGFGVVVVHMTRKVVLESYNRFGNSNSGIPVFEIWRTGNMLLVATQQGVARGNMADPLFIPSSWQNLAVTGTPSGASFTALYAKDQTIWATVSNVNYEWTGTAWRINNQITIGPIRRYVAWPDGALGFSNAGFARIHSTGTSNMTFSSGLPRAAHFSNGKNWIGTSENGLFELSETLQTVVKNVLPNGPSLNTFMALSFQNNVLVSGSSSSPGGGSGFVNTGYYIYRGNRWENYNKQSDTLLQRRVFDSVIQTTISDGTVYLGSFGKGILAHRLSDNSKTLYNRSNSTLYGLTGSADFIVVTGLAADKQNRIWATVLQTPTHPLHIFDPSTSVWTPFTMPFEVRANSGNFYGGLFVDSFDQAWIPINATGGSGNGLLVYRPGNLASTTDNKSVYLTETSANLPSAKINAVVQDKRGEVWIGTSRGLARFIFPELILDGGAAERQAQWLITEEGEERFYFLRDLNVNALAVNEANQKWIGSADNGLWLVNETGGTALAHFTRSNSPLISDNIASLAYDKDSGTLFIATSAGLMSYVDVSKRAGESSSSLFVYPNPFSYSKNSGSIIIDGLASVTTISILAVDGTLIRKINGASGRTSWDGLDQNGRQVATGVYMIVSQDKDGGKRNAGKVIITK